MSKRWNTSDIPRQDGRVVVVTGANTGLGLHTAEALAARGAEVVMACRNPEKARAARDAIAARNPGAKLVVEALDLGELASVASFAARFRDRYTRLDLLINNAGVMMPPASRTRDGFELQMGTNHLGHFALTGHLLPLLTATPGARVVTVSSIAHRVGDIDFDDLNWETRAYDKNASYGQSKLANLLFTLELQRRLEAAGADTLAVAAHPGWSATELQRNNALFRLLNPLMAQSAERGALPTLYAAVADDVKGGEYFGPDGFMEVRGAPTRARRTAKARDAAAAQRLWSVSEALTGVSALNTPAAA